MAPKTRAARKRKATEAPEEPRRSARLKAKRGGTAQQANPPATVPAAAEQATADQPAAPVTATANPPAASNQAATNPPAANTDQNQTETQAPAPAPGPGESRLERLPVELGQEIFNYLNEKDTRMVRASSQTLNGIALQPWLDRIANIDVAHDEAGTIFFEQWIAVPARLGALRRVRIWPSRDPYTFDNIAGPWVQNRWVYEIRGPADRLERSLARLGSHVAISLEPLFRLVRRDAPEYITLSLVRQRTLFSLRRHPQGFRTWTLVDTERTPDGRPEHFIPVFLRHLRFQSRAAGPDQDWTPGPFHNPVHNNWIRLMGMQHGHVVAGQAHGQLEALEVDLLVPMPVGGDAPDEFAVFLRECQNLRRLHLRIGGSANVTPFDETDFVLQSLMNPLVHHQPLPQRIRDLSLYVVPTSVEGYRWLESFILALDPAPTHPLRNLDFWLHVGNDFDLDVIIGMIDRLLANEPGHTRAKPSRNSLNLRLDYFVREIDIGCMINRSFRTQRFRIPRGPITAIRRWPELKLEIANWRRTVRLFGHP